MFMNLQPILVGFPLVAGLAVIAQAQTLSQAPVPGPSIANLPPEGPRASSLNSLQGGAQQASVAASGQYIGPAPGAGTGQLPSRFEKPGDYDQNVSLHPYSSNMGPRPN